MSVRTVRRTLVAAGLLLLATSACSPTDDPGPAASPNPAVAAPSSSAPTGDVGTPASPEPTPRPSGYASTATPVPSGGTAPATAEADEPVANQTWWAWGPLGLVLGLVVGFGVGRGRRGAGDAPDATPAPTPAPTSDAPPAPVAEPRLVRDLVLAHDLADDEASAGHLEEVLARLGAVRQDVAPGTPFDGDHHHAVGTDPTPGPGSVPVVVRTVRPGWRTDTTVLRRPEVVVARPTSHPPPT